MDNITFKQFINNFNFRYFRDWDNGANYYDTKIIRIFPPLKEYSKDVWFDFGIYDFCNKETTLELLETILTKEILNSYVSSIDYDDKLEIIQIYLTKEIKEI